MQKQRWLLDFAIPSLEPVRLGGIDIQRNQIIAAADE
jgi:hypothetical protein